MNEGDFQVRAAHKILRYDPIQKSFAAPKYIIKDKDPRLQKITVAEHGFFLPERFSAQQATETEEGRAKGKEQVIELDQSEVEFGAFDQFDPSEGPSGDLGDPSLTESSRDLFADRYGFQEEAICYC